MDAKKQPQKLNAQNAASAPNAPNGLDGKTAAANDPPKSALKNQPKSPLKSWSKNRLRNHLKPHPPKNHLMQRQLNVRRLWLFLPPPVIWQFMTS